MKQEHRKLKMNFPGSLGNICFLTGLTLMWTVNGCKINTASSQEQTHLYRSAANWVQGQYGVQSQSPGPGASKVRAVPTWPIQLKQMLSFWTGNRSTDISHVSLTDSVTHYQTALCICPMLQTGQVSCTTEAGEFLVHYEAQAMGFKPPSATLWSPALSCHL